MNFCDKHIKKFPCKKSINILSVKIVKMYCLHLTGTIPKKVIIQVMSV
jgi:hypothetical protein